MTKTNKSLGLPAEFGAIEEQGGKAVIAKDFFFSKTSLLLLPPEWWKLTVKYQLYFAKGKVADNLALGLPTEENVAAWKKLLTTIVFGESFKNHMTHGFNVGLGVASTKVLTYGGEWPRLRGDVKRLLFTDLMMEMVKGGVRNSDGLPLDMGLLPFNGRMHRKLGRKRCRRLHDDSGIPYCVGGTTGGEVVCINSLFLQSRAERGDEQFPDADMMIPKVALGRLVAGQFACCRP